MGFSQKQTVFILYAISGVLGITAVLLFSFYYTEKMSNMVINNINSKYFTTVSAGDFTEKGMTVTRFTDAFSKEVYTKKNYVTNNDGTISASEIQNLMKNLQILILIII